MSFIRHTPLRDAIGSDIPYTDIVRGLLLKLEGRLRLLPADLLIFNDVRKSPIGGSLDLNTLDLFQQFLSCLFLLVDLLPGNRDLVSFGIGFHFGRSLSNGDRVFSCLRCSKGFRCLLLFKRLEAGSFKWPRNPGEAAQINKMQYRDLLRGLNPIRPKIHEVKPGKTC